MQLLLQLERGWGVTPETLTCYCPAQKGLTTRSEHGWKLRLATSCRRRLPLAAALTPIFHRRAHCLYTSGSDNRRW